MLMADEKDVKTEIGVEELRDQLDALWEKHLILLDSYHQAQQQIASHFSRGFFDLAQATFKSTTRVRYGQEYTPHLALKVNDTPSPSTKPSDKGATEKSPVFNEESDKKDQEDKPEEQGQNDKPDESKKEDKPEDKEKTLNKVRDPLHWYGILVPPSLRSSQKSFNFAIHSPVIDAANSAQALHRVDMDIRKLRKDIKKAEKKRVV
jgi:hypothetical protein